MKLRMRLSATRRGFRSLRSRTFDRMGWSWQLTATERYIRNEFRDAVRFCEKDWNGYQDHFELVDPVFLKKYSLEKRLIGFINGPIYEDLKRNFPKIGRVAADMMRTVEGADSEQQLLHAIVKEAIVRAGEHREEVRTIIAT